MNIAWIALIIIALTASGFGCGVGGALLALIGVALGLLWQIVPQAGTVTTVAFVGLLLIVPFSTLLFLELIEAAVIDDVRLATSQSTQRAFHGVPAVGLLLSLSLALDPAVIGPYWQSVIEIVSKADGVQGVALVVAALSSAGVIASILSCGVLIAVLLAETFLWWVTSLLKVPPILPWQVLRRYAIFAAFALGINLMISLVAVESRPASILALVMAPEKNP